MLTDCEVEIDKTIGTFFISVLVIVIMIIFPMLVLIPNL